MQRKLFNLCIFILLIFCSSCVKKSHLTAYDNMGMNKIILFQKEVPKTGPHRKLEEYYLLINDINILEEGKIYDLSKENDFKIFFLNEYNGFWPYETEVTQGKMKVEKKNQLFIKFNIPKHNKIPSRKGKIKII